MTEQAPPDAEGKEAPVVVGELGNDLESELPPRLEEVEDDDDTSS